YAKKLGPLLFLLSLISANVYATNLNSDYLNSKVGGNLARISGMFF
ncbi:MAG: hypothetical protein ACI8VI_001821, partial [Granulosicoccus sp.]